MAEKFIINGGKKLAGEVEIMGSKNAALPILVATVLTKKDCVIDNLPLIEDINRMLEILEGMGAKIEWQGERKVKINCQNINPEKLPQKIISNFRGSVLVLGPLLARFGKLKMLSPGGCIIGARPLDTHFDAFLQLGFENYSKGSYYYFKKIREKDKEKNREVALSEFSVTATENVLLFSSFFQEKTILKIADLDYQVQELIKVLKKMGAKIKTAGPHSFEVKGKKELSGFSHKLISDPIEAGTFIVASLITKGDVLIKNAGIEHLTLFLKKLKSCGANFEIKNKNTIRVMPSAKIVIDRIQSLPYPGIHTDLQPELGVLATQTRGGTLIHDPLYEGRLKYLEELNKMGAEIIFCDPHRAIVNGPTLLYGIEIPSLDLRSGAALILAGLVARGTTTINNIYQIDRGYEKIEERLQKLGADIKRIKS
ncbi:MAG: UDP-N-acetylglucosamine 1-carboxyvinyltransferase [Patescibacteria group bacterium]